MENSNTSNSPSKHPYGKYVAIVITYSCILVGIILIAICRSDHLKYNALLEGGHYTQGKIVDMTYDSSSESYDTIVGFIVDGEVYKFYITYNSSEYRVGDTVKVLYEEGNPSNCAVERDSFVSQYLFSSIFLFAGIILIPFTYTEIFGDGSDKVRRARNSNNTSDVWNNDITHPERNQAPNRASTDYTDSNNKQRNYTQGNYTTKSSAKVTIGATAFYNKSDE